jgi:phosphotriesterase-related protein
MGAVQTTAGPVGDGELGLTLIHEHLRVRSEAVSFQFPHLYDEADEYERAVAQVHAAMERGVRTICDPTVMGAGRDIRFMSRVAEETGIQLVASTGIYTDHYVPPYFQNRDVDYMAEVFVHDFEAGIQGTGIKPGFLKCCTDQHGVTEDVEKVLRATARASNRTGRPIMTHSHPQSGQGLAQMRIFEEEGVPPERVLIGHTGDTDSLDYIEELLSHGPFIGMDRYGLDIILPTEQRNSTVVELARRGYADRMMLSQDACCTIDWYPREMIEEEVPNWHMTYLLDEIVPALKGAGVSAEQIDQMMVEAPRRWLSASA